MAKKSNNKHIDVSTMLSGDVQLFNKAAVTDIMETILKETYLTVANDTQLMDCKTVSDAVSCTASKFRQTALEKLEKRLNNE